MITHIRTANVLIAAIVMAVGVAAGAAKADTVLISPGTGPGDDIKNGGFESHSAGAGHTGFITYTQLEDWFNYGSDPDQNAAVTSGAFEGIVRPFIEGGDGASGRAPAVDTGYVIQAGDTFDLSFHYRDFGQWTINSDTFDAILYSSSGIIWSQTIKPTNYQVWTPFSMNDIPAANTGESLHLRFVANGGDDVYCSVDAITLTVVPAGPPGTLIYIK